jgi:hypothetical protein
MKSVVRIALQTDAAQGARLTELQQAFAQVCNALAPMVQKTSCWNRVALHHMAYKDLRKQFPELGSQMVCNAIYSVSRSCRLLFQHPKSPFNVQRLAGKPLPQLKFQPEAPVYFDRHTLSLKDGQVSMFTLDGRMRFNLALSPVDEQRFRTEKLREIVLTSTNAQFVLSFMFAQGDDANDGDAADPSGAKPELPEYVLVIEDAPAATAAPAAQPATTP